MACYETHFGQKIAGEFWFLGGQQSQRERRGLRGGSTESSFGIRSGFHSQLHPSTRVASVSLSVKWMQNNLPQLSARLWYYPRNYGEAENGAHKDIQTKQKSRPSFCLLRGLRGATEVVISTAAVTLVHDPSTVWASSGTGALLWREGGCEASSTPKAPSPTSNHGHYVRVKVQSYMCLWSGAASLRASATRP